MVVRFVWTKRALERWADGKADPRHTISAPNVADVYEGFVRQLRPGTPWMLVEGNPEYHEHARILAQGRAGR